MNYKEDMKRAAKDIEAIDTLENPFKVRLTSVITALTKLYQDHLTALFHDEFTSPEVKQQEHLAFKTKFAEHHLKFHQDLGCIQNIHFFNTETRFNIQRPCTNMSETAASLNVINPIASDNTSSDFTDLLLAKPEHSPSL